MKFIIVSGRSGSGKSICLHALEDMGFYCIDNLPAGLLSALPQQMNQEHRHAAVSIDARNLPQALEHFQTILAELKQSTACEIIFFDADDNTLLKRFSETRRKHPLTSEVVSLHEALQQEHVLLEPIARLADMRIDTSQLNVMQLRELLQVRIQSSITQELSILFESFAYKSGVPTDADYVFDVRCLPNPYWQPKLRTQTGRDEEVKQFLNEQLLTPALLENLQQFLLQWLPQFSKDNRRYMTIAIGCTGGQHRSVYIAEELAHFFKQHYSQVQLRHREISSHQIKELHHAD